MAYIEAGIRDFYRFYFKKKKKERHILEKSSTCVMIAIPAYWMYAESSFENN